MTLRTAGTYSPCRVAVHVKRPGELMPKRLLVTEAGTGASEFLIRHLRAGNGGVFISGSHSDPFYLRKSAANRRWVVPPASDPRFAATVRRIVVEDRIDAIIPNADDSVVALSAARRQLPRRLFLPRHDTVTICQDKYRLNRLLGARGVPVPRTFPVRGLSSIGSIFRRLGSPRRVWCRIRTGSMSFGAAPVDTPSQARAWIRYWAEVRRIPATTFTLSEYLPGRDFACLMLWKAGRLIVAKTCERLSYFFGGSQPSGRSSMAGLSRTVREPRVVEVCAQAIRALDPKASGAFSVDLRANADGEPCITEINAGRLIAQAILLDGAGTHSLTLTYARLALGEPVTLHEEYDAPEDYYFVRNADTEPLVFHASEFFDGVDDARVTGERRIAGARDGRTSEGPLRPVRHRLEIPGAHDRHALEELRLQIRRVAEEAGLTLARFDVTD